MRLTSCLFLVFCLIPVRPGTTADLNGHFKSLNLYQQAAINQDQDVWLSADSLRLNLYSDETGSGPTWQVSLEQLFLYQSPNDSLSLPDRDKNRIEDLAWDGNSGHDLSWQLQVDRLNLQWGEDDTILSLGRQGIGFGRISLFSPLDIIAPFSPTALDTEVRTGVDALRMQHYFDVVGEAGATMVFGGALEDSSFLTDLTLNIGEVDILMIGGQLRDRPMVGFGLAGQLGGLGWKGEMSIYKGSDTDSQGGDLYDDFSIAAVELEYRFPIDLVLDMQYLYNGPGSNHPREYLLVAQSAPVEEGLTYLYGKHYLLSALSRDLTPLVRLSGLLIVNLKDESWFLRPMLELSMSDNVSLEIYWNSYQGDNPDLVFGQPVPRSEFGSFEDGGGFLLKVYF